MTAGLDFPRAGFLAIGAFFFTGLRAAFFAADFAPDFFPDVLFFFDLLLLLAMRPAPTKVSFRDRGRHESRLSRCSIEFPRELL